MRKIGLVALTQKEKNQRHYEKHREEELARNKQFYRDNKETQRIRHRNNRHHIKQEWFDAKLAEQDNKCALCLKEFVETPHIDHDHKCCKPSTSCEKCRRDLLCKDCNLGLGRFVDDIAVLERAIQYLKHHKGIQC
jgi:recombination endonuclease VII